MKILREFITLTGLCDRWQCDIDLIAPYTQRRLNKRGFPDIDPILQAYRAVSARVCSMGMAQACDAKEIGAIAKEDFVPDWRGETLYNRGEVVFDMDQVRALERAEPTLLCTTVPYATAVVTTPQGYEPGPTPPKAYEPEPQYFATAPGPYWPESQYAQPAPSQPGPEELDQVKAQLAQVSAERDKLQEENNSLRRELDTAREELARAAQAPACPSPAVREGALALPKYGMISFVDDCYRQGMTVKQVAEALLNEMKLTKPQIAVLLHTKRDEMADWGQPVDRILNGGTGTLAWTVPGQVVGKKIPGG